MTVTVDKNADVPLSANDYLLSRHEHGPDLVRFALPWTLGVNVHLREDMPIQVRVYDEDNRITVKFGGFSADVDVYLPADQIDRLIHLLIAARDRLRTA